MAKANKKESTELTEAVLDQEVIDSGVDVLNGVAGDVASAETEAPKSGGRRKQAKRDQIMFTVPKELLDLVKARAAAHEGGSQSMAEYVRELVAHEFDFVLPPMQKGGGGVRRYATKEEANAAKKEKAVERNKLIAALLDKARSGEIDLASLGITIPVPVAREKREPIAVGV